MNLDITEQDKAYLAGIIDGEGCFNVQRAFKKHPTHSIQHSGVLDIYQSNRSFLESLQILWGGLGSICSHKVGSLSNKTCFRWAITSKQLARILPHVIPYLRIKKNQAEALVELDKTKRARGIRGERLSEAEIEYRDWIWSSVKNLNQGYLVDGF